MNDSEFELISMQVTQLLWGTEYRNAFRLARREGVLKLVTAQRPSEEYQAIRFLIGTVTAHPLRRYDSAIRH